MKIIDADLEKNRISAIIKEIGTKTDEDAKIFSAKDIFKILNDAPTFIQGEVTKADYSFQRITFIKPTEHHYEEKGEKPYIKYGCPVCEALGNKHQSVKEKINVIENYLIAIIYIRFRCVSSCYGSL